MIKVRTLGGLHRSFTQGSKRVAANEPPTKPLGENATAVSGEKVKEAKGVTPTVTQLTSEAAFPGFISRDDKVGPTAGPLTYTQGSRDRTERLIEEAPELPRAHFALDVRELIRRRRNRSEGINNFLFLQYGIRIDGIKGAFGCEQFSDISQMCAAGMKSEGVGSTSGGPPAVLKSVCCWHRKYVHPSGMKSEGIEISVLRE